MDNETTDGELTSSMGSVLSSLNKDDKNDASDSTPTSSTDAHSSATTSDILTDDPISSTSSDAQDPKGREADMDEHFSLPAVPVSKETETTESNTASLVSDADLLYMNITDVSDEKITEDVEDIVQDLENLLGESSSPFSASHGRTSNTDISSCIENSEPAARKDEAMDVDSVQLEVQPQSVGEKNVMDVDSVQLEVQPQSVGEKNVSDATKSDLTQSDVEEVGIAGKSSQTTDIVAPYPIVEDMEVPEETTAQHLTSEIIVETAINPQQTELDAAIQGILNDNFPVSEAIDTQGGKSVSADGVLSEHTVSDEPSENDDYTSPMEPEHISGKTDTLDVTRMDEVVGTVFESLTGEEANTKPESLSIVTEQTHMEIMQAVETDEKLEHTPQLSTEKCADNLPAEGSPKPLPEKSADCPSAETNISYEYTSIQKEQHDDEALPVNKSDLSEANVEKPIGLNIAEKVDVNVVKQVEQTVSGGAVPGQPLDDELLNSGVEPNSIKKTAYVCGPGGSDEIQEISKQNPAEESIPTPVKTTDSIVNIDVLVGSNENLTKQEVEHTDGDEQIIGTLENIVDDAVETTTVQRSELMSNMELSTENTSIELKIEEINIESAIREDVIMGGKSSQFDQKDVIQKAETSNQALVSSIKVEQKNKHDLEASNPDTSIITDKTGSDDSAEVLKEVVSNKAIGDVESSIDKTDIDVDECSSMNKENLVTCKMDTDSPECRESLLVESVEDTQTLKNVKVENEELVAVEEVQLGEKEGTATEHDDTEKEQNVRTTISVVKGSDDSLAETEATGNIAITDNRKGNLCIDEQPQDIHPLQSDIQPSQFLGTDGAAEHVETTTEANADLDNNAEPELTKGRSQPLPSTEDVKQDEMKDEEMIENDVDDGAHKDLEQITPVIQSELSAEQQLPVTISSSGLEDDVPDHSTVTDAASQQFSSPISEESNTNLKEPLTIKIDGGDKIEATNLYSPIITIKPSKSPIKESEVDTEEKEELKGSLKMTITKQSDTMHSILKVHTSDEDTCSISKTDESEANKESQELPVPKLIIKSVAEQTELPLSPKMTTRSSKIVPNSTQRSSSPRITIKPIIKPESKSEVVSPLKITISKSKNDDTHKQKHSPKLTTRSSKTESDLGKDHSREHHTPRKSLKSKQTDNQDHSHSPRVTIKPIVKPCDELESGVNPKITIKPIPKPFEGPVETSGQSPRVTIKPIVKPLDEDEDDDMKMIEQSQVDKTSPKITIKPVVKPMENEHQQTDFEDSIKERIVLKINKSRKRDVSSDDDRSEKLAKIKLKFSKEGGHPHIVQQESREESHKRSSDTDYDSEKTKRQKTDKQQIETSHSKLKDILSCNTRSMKTHYINEETVCSDDVIITKDAGSEVSNDSSMKEDTSDPLSEIPVFEITPDGAKTVSNSLPSESPATPVPRKRGRPRKIPLQIREDFKDEAVQQADAVPVPTPVIVQEPPQVQESSRPKRSCRGQSARATLGIKPRKPRGAGRSRSVTRAISRVGRRGGRGSRGGSRGKKNAPEVCKSPQMKESVSLLAEEAKLVAFQKTQETVTNVVDLKSILPAPTNIEIPPEKEVEKTEIVTTDIVMFEEETRMSADTSSRAQTPAKQIITCDVEESQSSVQSSATTESAKARKGPRLEVHQEPEGAVISADQLAEYCWGTTGPFMLQEQVAQFLGIKSFKRKYPSIQRRTVDMQERDFIRESGLASEAMCDLGLTAVNSADILDIMYTDFQDKYEEYCKHQRNRQAKDLINKQKALSLAASQEKNKLDITEQAVHSAVAWNANFNKVRREQRKACMDLQTLTVHYPKGKIKQIPKEKIGSYPVAVVPGQFTDYYKEFTPTEINNLPLNTMCYDPIYRAEDMECDSPSDDSGSGSDSSSSSSDSSDSDSSDGEDCKICNNNKSPTTKSTPVSTKVIPSKVATPQSKVATQTPRTSGPVTRVTSARSRVAAAQK